MLKKPLQEFIENTNLSYGYYKRIYAKKYICFSSNDNIPLEDTIEKYFSSIITKEVTSLHQFDFLWNEYLSSEDIKALEEKYSLFHGLVTLRFYRTHFDVFAFAMGERNPYSSSFYLSKYANHS